jgi:hypothetical protein
VMTPPGETLRVPASRPELGTRKQKVNTNNAEYMTHNCCGNTLTANPAKLLLTSPCEALSAPLWLQNMAQRTVNIHPQKDEANLIPNTKALSTVNSCRSPEAAVPAGQQLLIIMRKSQ